jgi:DNA-binding LacI/PurR family transcriptional regulator
MLPVKYVQPQHRIVDLVQQSSLDVALLIGHFDRELLTGIVEVCPRIVLVDHMMRGLNVDTILVDNREGGYAAMECLIAHGHRKRIGVITGPRNQLVTRERLAGVFECIEQHDLSRDTLRIAEGDFLFKGGYDTARRLLQDNPPTALFVMNDEMAAGAVQAIHEHTRLRIPEDISVIGFDDSAVSRQTRKPLSTIHISKPLMGRLAVQRAVALMKKDAHAPITTVVPTRLIERETTGPCSRT